MYKRLGSKLHKVEQQNVLENDWTKRCDVTVQGNVQIDEHINEGADQHNASRSPSIVYDSVISFHESEEDISREELPEQTKNTNDIRKELFDGKNIPNNGPFGTFSVTC